MTSHKPGVRLPLLSDIDSRINVQSLKKCLKSSKVAEISDLFVHQAMEDEDEDALKAVEDGEEIRHHD